MQSRLRFDPGELDPDPIIATPADLASVAGAIEGHVEKEFVGNLGLDRDLQLGAVLMLIAQHAGDLRVLDSADDRCALEHARTVVALWNGRLYLKGGRGVSHRCSANIDEPYRPNIIKPFMMTPTTYRSGQRVSGAQQATIRKIHAGRRRNRRRSGKDPAH